MKWSIHIQNFCIGLQINDTESTLDGMKGDVMALLQDEMFSLVHWSISTHWIDAAVPTGVSPELSEKGASFVTLELDGQLRGCVGSLVAHRELSLDLVENAKHAAFQDPRFRPLTKEEYKDTLIEISLLTPPEECFFKTKEELREKIVPGRDGVILSAMGRRATFLPQVWEQLPEFEQFFAHLSQKAGIGSDPFFLNPTVQTYQVKRFREQ